MPADSNGNAINNTSTPGLQELHAAHNASPSRPVLHPYSSNTMAHRALLRPVGRTPSAVLSCSRHHFARFSTVIDGNPLTPPAPSNVASDVFNEAVQATSPRTTWTKEQIAEIYNTPLINLTYGAVRNHFTQTHYSEGRG